MAETVNFPEANTRMNAPDSMDTCEDIVAFRGPETIITCWKLTDTELKQIQKTGIVWLHLWGDRMQPAYIGADRPFEAPTKEVD